MCWFPVVRAIQKRWAHSCNPSTTATLNCADFHAFPELRFENGKQKQKWTLEGPTRNPGLIHFKYKAAIGARPLIAADFSLSTSRLRMRWRVKKKLTSYAATTWIRCLFDLIDFCRPLRRGAVLHSGPILRTRFARGPGPRLLSASRLDANKHALSSRTSWGS